MPFELKNISVETNTESANISSAEMTAYWRSLFPELSHDSYSIRLASTEGILKAKEFEKKFDYPLVGRKVSVRAGFILEKAKELLSTGQYDACISFASGFSLLTYCIASELGEKAEFITFYDSDLLHIIEERNHRIQTLIHEGNLPTEVSNIKALPIDLEIACKQNISFKKLFESCKRPLFIVEGVIYFLSDTCVQWMLNAVSSFDNAALIFDYWPQDGINESTCFKRVVNSLKGFMPESVKSFWDKTSIDTLYKSFSHVNDEKIGMIENKMSAELSEIAQFSDQNLFFPVNFIVARKETGHKSDIFAAFRV